ncbi:MAG: hypothetical protein CMM52_07535 [Rhodospirillaceae bacterium]|nr:hypothetical protein [Rhodospirillaceae bacterium]|tara:strand:- start:16921 stop:17421 length:501 start_codon:yes stop_codon:yes gene_type:complete
MKRTFLEKIGFSETAPPQDKCDQVLHLSFENQIALWSLRAVLKGPDYSERVHRQFHKTLPTAAARLAFESIDTVVQTVCDYGIRSLRFNCLCQSALTEDEQKLIEFFQIAQTDTLFEIREAARAFVNPPGIDAWVNATLTFFAALETRHSESAQGMTALTLSTTIH